MASVWPCDTLAHIYIHYKVHEDKLVFVSVLQAAFLKEAIANLLVDSAGPGQASGGQSRKRHANLQEKIQGLWNTANLFNKAIDSFEGMSCLASICVSGGKSLPH